MSSHTPQIIPMHVCARIQAHTHAYLHRCQIRQLSDKDTYTWIFTQMSDKADEFVGALAVVVHGPSEQGKLELILETPTASRSLIDGDEFEDTIEAGGPDDSLFRGARPAFRVSFCAVRMCVCIYVCMLVQRGEASFWVCFCAVRMCVCLCVFVCVFVCLCVCVCVC